MSSLATSRAAGVDSPAGPTSADLDPEVDGLYERTRRTSLDAPCSYGASRLSGGRRKLLRGCGAAGAAARLGPPPIAMDSAPVARGLRGRLAGRVRGGGGIGRSDRTRARADALRAAGVLGAARGRGGACSRRAAAGGRPAHTTWGGSPSSRGTRGTRSGPRSCSVAGGRARSVLARVAGASSPRWPHNSSSTTPARRHARGLRSACGARTHLRFMVWVWTLDAALAPDRVSRSRWWRSGAWPASVLLVLPLIGLLGVFARQRQVGIDRALELGHAYRGTSVPAGRRRRGRRHLHGDHCRDVVDLVLAVAEELGVDARGRRDAEFVALLHDVGKIRIPKRVDQQAGSADTGGARPDRDARGGGRKDARSGGRAARPGRKIVRSHHERFDGTGYRTGWPARRSR